MTILQHFIKMDGERFHSLTDLQKSSALRVIDRQGAENFQHAFIDHVDHTLMLSFKHILIGIEPDGYAHS
jgi:hypothetical protein